MGQRQSQPPAGGVGVARELLQDRRILMLRLRIVAQGQADAGMDDTGVHIIGAGAGRGVRGFQRVLRTAAPVQRLRPLEDEQIAVGEAESGSAVQQGQRAVGQAPGAGTVRGGIGAGGVLQERRRLLDRAAGGGAVMEAVANAAEQAHDAASLLGVDGSKRQGGIQYVAAMSEAAQPTRHIIHADMDAFFASVEQHDHPEWRGQPVLVGGSPQARGVVAAASYEARQFGCRSAMPMKTAVRLCPQAVVVRPRFRRYQEVSEAIMAVFQRFTPLVEPLSLDEAFLDITHLAPEGRPLPGLGPAPTAEAIARQIKQAVRAATGLSVTCGVATSKSVAKVASGINKPDGLTVVAPGTEAAFLAPLPVRSLWGIGPKTAERLEQAGVTSVADLSARPLAWLIERFGVRGEWFARLARGEDDRPIEVEHERKSISHETTFTEDVSDAETLRRTLREQSAAVARRLRRDHTRGRTVQVKLRLADFTTFTRQATLPAPTDDAAVIAASAQALLERERQPGRQFRLVGVGVHNLVPVEQAVQLSLFGPGGTVARDAKIEALLQRLRDRYGDAAPKRGL